MELRPNITAFFYYRFAIRVFFLGIVFFFLGLVGKLFYDVSMLISLAVAVVFILLNWISLNIKYNKELYIFSENKIIRKGGGIFTNYETELLVEKITHVKLDLPYLKNKFFGVGNVSIQSAGSGGVEVFLSAIDNPLDAYKEVQSTMKKNGFALTMKNLVQEERPNTFGIILEMLQQGVAIGAVGFFVVLMPLLGSLASIYSILSTSEHRAIGIVLLTVGGFAFLIIIAWLVGSWIISFLDKKRRVYRLYDDSVTYSEGFLAKHYAFIPIENLSDAETTQSLIPRLLGLYNVKVSCQGGGQEIMFDNMENGKTFEENLDKQIGKKKAAPAKKTVKKATTVKAAKRSYSSFTGSYKMQWSRNLGGILIPLGVAFILGIIIGIFYTPFFLVVLGAIPFLFFIVVATVVMLAISISATKFTIAPTSIKSSYKFLSTKEVEFSLDKITGIKITRGVFDRIFNTVSIQFWSIGSSSDITFKTIKMDDELIANLVGKIGLSDTQEIERWDAAFSFMTMLKMHPLMHLIAFLIIIGGFVGTAYFPGLVALGIVPLILYLIAGIYLPMKYRKTHLHFFSSFTRMDTGIITLISYYAPYDGIKDLKAVQYPFSKAGSLTFNVAGESLVGSGNKQVLVSNAFTFKFASDVFEKQTATDRTVASNQGNAVKQRADEQTILTARPAVANTLLSAAIICGVITAIMGFFTNIFGRIELGVGIGVGFSIFILFFTILGVKMFRYYLTATRVIIHKGILRKTRTTVSYSKINHLSVGQGMLNKIFKNGTVAVHTAGSTMSGPPEATIRNIPAHTTLYEKLKEMYAN